ncbi:MAG: hypothetical protein ACXVD8_12535 [Actinomycetota bacterium]
MAQRLQVRPVIRPANSLRRDVIDLSCRLATRAPRMCASNTIGQKPRASAFGIAITSVSIVVLGALAGRKRAVSRLVRSRALLADSWLSATGAALAVIAVLGTALGSALNATWMDPSASLLVALIAAGTGFGFLRRERGDTGGIALQSQANPAPLVFPDRSSPARPSPSNTRLTASDPLPAGLEPLQSVQLRVFGEPDRTDVGIGMQRLQRFHLCTRRGASSRRRLRDGDKDRNHDRQRKRDHPQNHRSPLPHGARARRLEPLRDGRLCHDSPFADDHESLAQEGTKGL